MPRIQSLRNRLAIALACAGLATGGRATDLTIQSYDATGRLVFSNVPTAAVYVVESAISPTGPWMTAQAARAPISELNLGTNGPSICFYRVVAGITNAVTPEPADMTLIPAGNFQMGDNLNDGWEGEWPVHMVYVSGFYMDKTGVTWAKWQEVRTYADANGYDIGSVGAGIVANHPAYAVNWYDVVKWCNARSQRDGLVPCYSRDGGTYKTGQYDDIVCNWSANGYRLPTEAEREKAARGGLSCKRFPWGDTIDHTRANYYAAPATYFYDLGYEGLDTRFQAIFPCTSPAGSFAPNDYGLYDMSGNLWEWCWDWYGTYYSGSVNNPRGPAFGSSRVLRGGTWMMRASSARVACRAYTTPDVRYGSFGFRSVRAQGQ
jgi:formylglycine-generating enzyme required for sulfatase activity